MPRLRCALRSGPPATTRSASRSAIAHVASSLALSTTMSSMAGCVWRRTEVRHSSIVRSLLRVGTTTLTSTSVSDPVTARSFS